MKCTLCGHVYDKNEQNRACAACLFAGKCNLLRCPNCGFESVPDPEWITKLRQAWNRLIAQTRKQKTQP